MTKKHVFIIFLLIIIVVVTSCATSVSTQYMVPSKYDMSNYRTLAIVNPTPYRFKAYDLPSPVVRDLSGTSPIRVYSGFGVSSERALHDALISKVLEKANKSTYFTIVPPSSSKIYRDDIKKMEKDGIDAILYLFTEDIDIDEFIYAKEVKSLISSEGEGELDKEVIELVYYLEQSVRIKFMWEVRSTSTSALLARDSYSDIRTLTTKLTSNESSSIYAPRLNEYMNSIAVEFSSTIFSQLEPSVVTRNIKLMKNKPKSNRVEEAYDMVKDGNLRIAQELFEKEWKRRDHLPSAYNAAILLEALDERDDAIKLLEKVYKESGNTKVKTLLDTMKERQSSTKQAESQLR